MTRRFIAKSILLFLFISNPLISYNQINSNIMIGSYYSVNNHFERWSILRLHANSIFDYDYALGGCQAIITGTWGVSKNRLSFKNDADYLLLYKDSIPINDTIKIPLTGPMYPDLSKTDWIIRKKGIKPKKSIDTGCFLENGIHKKK